MLLGFYSNPNYAHNRLNNKACIWCCERAGLARRPRFAHRKNGNGLGFRSIRSDNITMLGLNSYPLCEASDQAKTG